MRPPESFLCQPIRSLQTMLRYIAENDPEYVPVIPDGIYGPETMTAVTRFQRNKEIPATGVTNQETWEAVVDTFDSVLIEQEAAQSIGVSMDANQVIHRGERDYLIFLVQSMLMAMSEIYHCICTPSMSGMLDTATSDAISDFQQVCQLPVSGELDKCTWKNMALQYPLAVSMDKRKHRK